MAKKQTNPEQEQSVGYENVEPEWGEDPTTEAVITKPGGEAVALTPPTERSYRVSFVLPYGVLVALLDQDHDDADIEAAEELGLIDAGPVFAQAPLTDLGKLVLDGFDKVAVGHKMAATWREQHNSGTDGV